jgi:hypothetical protein
MPTGGSFGRVRASYHTLADVRSWSGEFPDERVTGSLAGVVATDAVKQRYKDWAASAECVNA